MPLRGIHDPGERIVFEIQYDMLPGSIASRIVGDINVIPAILMEEIHEYRLTHDEFDLLLAHANLKARYHVGFDDIALLDVHGMDRA